MFRALKYSKQIYCNVFSKRCSSTIRVTSQTSGIYCNEITGGFVCGGDIILGGDHIENVKDVKNKKIKSGYVTESMTGSVSFSGKNKKYGMIIIDDQLIDLNVVIEKLHPAKRKIIELNGANCGQRIEIENDVIWLNEILLTKNELMIGIKK